MARRKRRLLENEFAFHDAARLKGRGGRNAREPAGRGRRHADSPLLRHAAHSTPGFREYDRPMHVLITGGAGFLGRRLATSLLQRGTLTGSNGEQEDIDRMTLLDVVPATDVTDRRVTVVTGDVADPVLIKSLV